MGDQIVFRLGASFTKTSPSPNSKRTLTAADAAKLERFIKTLRMLPENTKTVAADASIETAMFMVRSAKQRAPKWSGNLRRSIGIRSDRKTKKGNSVTISADAPYALFQEEGFVAHTVHRGQFTRINLPYFRHFSRWMVDKSLIGGGVYVSTHKPFFAPAFRAGVAKSDGIYDRHISKMLREEYSRATGSRRVRKRLIGAKAQMS